MIVLFFILLLLSLVALVVGLFKPDLVLRFMPKEKRNRKKVLLVFGLSSLVFFIMMGVSVPDEEEIESTEKVEEVQKEEEVEEIEVFTLTEEGKNILQKPYADMTDEERDTLDYIQTNYDKFNDEEQAIIDEYLDTRLAEKEVIEEEIRGEEERKEAERKAIEEKEAAEREAEEKKEREAKEKEEKEAKAREEKRANQTLAQDNAIRSAEDYLNYTAFSKSGLIKQLEYEGYSNADATYAVDELTVDWNEQALQSGKDYLDYTSFSRSGLIKQLEFEGYSTEQATYAVDQIGL